MVVVVLLGVCCAMDWMLRVALRLRVGESSCCVSAYSQSIEVKGVRAVVKDGGIEVYRFAELRSEVRRRRNSAEGSRALHHHPVLSLPVR